MRLTEFDGLKGFFLSYIPDGSDKCYFNDSLFSIGPFGDKVAFSYQQRRSFLFCKHFYDYTQKYDVSLKKKKIVILGAGISGVATFSALKLLGYENVYLIDKASDYLMRQHDAEHRLVHPNYNTWPYNNAFSATTTYNPICNWYCDTAPSVCLTLRNEFEETLKRVFPHTDDINRYVYLNADVTKIRSIDDKISLSIKRTSEEKWKHTFPTTVDFVISCVGFCDEVNLEVNGQYKYLSSPYWAEDELSRIADKYKSNPMEEGAKTLYFVGNGDGSILDASRFVASTSCDAQTIDVFSKFFLKTISYLRATDYQEIQSLENCKSLWEARSDKSSIFENEISKRAHSFSDCVEEVFLPLVDFVLNDSIPQIPLFKPEGLKDLLSLQFNLFDQSLCERLKIISPSSEFQNGIAPINAIAQSILKFHNNDYFLAGILHPTDASNPDAIAKVVSDLSEPFLIKEEELMHFVTRKGAIPAILAIIKGVPTKNLVNHLEDDDVKKITARLREMGQQDLSLSREPRTSDIVFDLMRDLEQNNLDVELRFQSLIERTGEFLEKYFPGCDLVPEAAPEGQFKNEFELMPTPATYFKIIYPEGEEAQIVENARLIGGIDHQFFGVPAVFESEKKQVRAKKASNGNFFNKFLGRAA